MSCMSWNLVKLQVHEPSFQQASRLNGLYQLRFRISSCISYHFVKWDESVDCFCLTGLPCASAYSWQWRGWDCWLCWNVRVRSDPGLIISPRHSATHHLREDHHTEPQGEVVTTQWTEPCRIPSSWAKCPWTYHVSLYYKWQRQYNGGKTLWQRAHLLPTCIEPTVICRQTL